MKTNITIWTAAGAAVMHFICCGLPLIAAVFGASVAGLGIGQTAMSTIFFAAAAMLGLSWAIHFIRRCDCKGRAQLTILSLSTALFAAAVIAKLMASIMEAPVCH